MQQLVRDLQHCFLFGVAAFGDSSIPGEAFLLEPSNSCACTKRVWHGEGSLKWVTLAAAASMAAFVTRPWVTSSAKSSRWQQDGLHSRSRLSLLQHGGDSALTDLSLWLLQMRRSLPWSHQPQSLSLPAA